MTRHWLAVAAVAVVTALLTYLVSSALPPTYRANSVVRVSTGAGVLSSRDAVTASNELAAQFSQLVKTSAVTDRASREAGLDAAVGRDNVSAEVLSNQNLIQVSTTSSDPEVARRHSVVLASVLTDVATSSLEDTVTPVVEAQLVQLDKAIRGAERLQRKAQDTADRATPGSGQQAVAQAKLNGMIQQVQSLQLRRMQIQQDTTLRSAERQVVLTELGPSGPPVQDSPKPVLYAIIAFALAAVVGAQAAVVLSGRRRDG